MGIVVLKTDLQFDGLSEFSGLLILEDGLDALLNLGVCDVLAHFIFFLRLITLKIYYLIVIISSWIS